MVCLEPFYQFASYSFGVVAIGALGVLVSQADSECLHKLQSQSLSITQKDHIRRCVRSCEDGIFELHLTLGKIQKHAEPLRKMVYPFREKSLSKSLQRVSELQNSLAAAFLGLNIDILDIVSANRKVRARSQSGRVPLLVLPVSSKNISDPSKWILILILILTSSFDYSDCLSELTGTVTALTSLGNTKKICPRQQTRQQPQRNYPLLDRRSRGR